MSSVMCGSVQSHFDPACLQHFFLFPAPLLHLQCPTAPFFSPRVIPVVVDQTAALQEALHGEPCLVVSLLQFRSEFLPNLMKMIFHLFSPPSALHVCWYPSLWSSIMIAEVEHL